MTIHLHFKDNSRKIINLHPSFFESVEVSISKRAMDIAEMDGIPPYKIEVYRGSKEVFSRTISKNEPTPKTRELKIDEKDIKKQLRKQHKNDKFTYKIYL